MAIRFHGPRAVTRSVVIAAALLAGACAISPDARVVTQEAKPEPTTEPPTGPFVTAHGSRLFADGEEFAFKAVNFSNGDEERSHNSAAATHHGEEDFTRVRKLGFNTIRFAFNGHWFERDRDGFLAWMDSNIASARDQGLKLVLDMHVPIGGFWLDPGSPKVDFSLWTSPALQERNIT